jgi:DNA-binding transcriptional ArsR family regulator
VSDAAALVGLLAEEDRLKVVAALALGATTVDEVVAATGLDARRTSSALERLGAGGLVVGGTGGSGLRLAGERFKEAAQAEARRRASEEPVAAFEGTTPEAAAVLRNFVADGRLRQIPASHGKRLVVLDWLARRFEPGKTYPERDVNLLLGMAHGDVAALRRYLVDDGFLERRDGFYWRAGGTFDVE